MLVGAEWEVAASRLVVGILELVDCIGYSGVGVAVIVGCGQLVYQCEQGGC